MNTGGYPLGAKDDPNAPYNQVPLSEEEVEVCVSVTYHKTFKIKVTDYTIIEEGRDEDGDYYKDVDFSSCDLYKAVHEQIDLSNISENSGWTEDEFEVILD